MAESARMADFIGWAGLRHGRAFADYSELWAWSVQEVERFWADIWEYCGVRASEPYERVLASKEMPGARWFEGAQLNYAENMLARERDPAGDGAAARLGATSAGGAELGRAVQAGGRRGGWLALAGPTSAATVSPPTCRTFPRR